MLSILEKKAKDKILNLKNENKKISKVLTENLNLQMELKDLIEAHEQLKQSKDNKIIYLILDIIFILLININPIFIIATLYATIAIFIEKDNIKEIKKFIESSDYKYYSQEGLEREYNITENRTNKIKKNISNKKNKIKEYSKIIKEIKHVRDLEKNVNDKNFEQLEELYMAVPALAFNSKEEYKNYLSYEDEKFKNDIIKTKILSKKK